MKQLLCFLVLSIIFLIACNKSTTDYAAQAVCTGNTPTYLNDVAVIINNNCAVSGCHNNAASSAGIALEGFANASSQFKDNKKNLISIHHGKGASNMPKNASKLSDADINKLDCWVKNGCPN